MKSTHPAVCWHPLLGRSAAKGKFAMTSECLGWARNFVSSVERNPIYYTIHGYGYPPPNVNKAGRVMRALWWCFCKYCKHIVGNFHIVQIFADILVIMKISAARIIMTQESWQHRRWPSIIPPSQSCLDNSNAEILDNTPTGILRVEYVGQELYMWRGIAV